MYKASIFLAEERLLAVQNSQKLIEGVCFAKFLEALVQNQILILVDEQLLLGLLGEVGGALLFSVIFVDEVNKFTKALKIDLLFPILRKQIVQLVQLLGLQTVEEFKALHHL